VDETSDTVENLVDRFALRRRAETAEFHAGVQLARSGRVMVTEVTDVQLRAVVSDREPVEVTVITDDGAGLSGRCTCKSSTYEVCRHQVAATHTLWMQRRESANDFDSPPPV
jgi:uncharacterized Zn finger protein